MKILLAFIGAKGAGKDAASFHVVHKYGADSFAFAEPLKATVWSLFQSRIKDKERIYGTIEKKEETIEGWEIHPTLKEQCGFTEKYWSGRRLQQWFGTEVVRYANDNTWVDMLLQQVHDSERQLLTVTDCRYPNEYKALCNIDGVKTIFIKLIRNTVDNEFTGHASEAHYDNFEYDYSIVNNRLGLEHLQEAIEEIIDLIYESNPPTF